MEIIYSVILEKQTAAMLVMTLLALETVMTGSLVVVVMMLLKVELVMTLFGVDPAMTI